MPVSTVYAVLRGVFGALFLAMVFFGPAGAVDANLASQADLQSVRGIGPAIAARIVAERERGPYLDLDDLRERVRGIGKANLQRMTAGGLQVSNPAERAGGEPSHPSGGAARDPARARGWVRELASDGNQSGRPSSPGRIGW